MQRGNAALAGCFAAESAPHGPFRDRNEFRLRARLIRPAAFLPVAMAGLNGVSRRRRTNVSTRSARRTVDHSRSALVIIDQRPLQRAAWAKLHTARKRLEKAARDLHRHEEIDSPAYHSWLHRTFPLLVTTLRELQDALLSKMARIERVQAMSFLSGRSIKRLWREERQREVDPASAGEGRAFDDWEEDSPRDEAAPDNPSTPQPARSQTARDIYRRLVQRLHPDHVGEWTAHLEHLWHEVQQAWSAGDTDWLARLEVEWEASHEILGPTSPLGRLYRAIEELDAARRDTERKLRDYRDSPAWRFTLTEKKRATLHARVEAGMQADIAALRRELKPIDAMIAAWEEDWTRADHRSRRPRRRPSW